MPGHLEMNIQRFPAGQIDKNILADPACAQNFPALDLFMEFFQRFALDGFRPVRPKIGDGITLDFPVQVINDRLDFRQFWHWVGS